MYNLKDYDLKKVGILLILIGILLICIRTTKADDELIVTANGLCYNGTIEELTDENICNERFTFGFKL